MIPRLNSITKRLFIISHRSNIWIFFKSDPEKYKPQFGAWCAYAVSLGRTAPIDVSTFSIVNGRLVIQHNQKAVKGWNEDVQGNLKLADKYGRQLPKTGKTNSYRR